MTVQAIKAPMILAEGWQSLLDQKTISSNSFTTQFFKDCTERQEALSSDQKKSLFKTGRWQIQAVHQVLRDYYMRFQILQNSDLLGRIMFIARIIEPSKNLFNDIDTLLQTSFDPNWIVLQHLTDYTLKTADLDQYQAIMTTCPDGNLKNCEKVYAQEKLLRYRFVHHVLLHNIAKRPQVNLPLFKTLELTRTTSLERLKPKSNSYCSEAYYYTVLKCNQKLRENLSKTLNVSLEGQKGNGFVRSPDDMAEDLTDDDRQVVSGTLKTLRKMKKKGDPSLFPALYKSESSLLLPAVSTLVVTGTTEKGFKKAFFAATQFTAFSHTHRINYLKQYLAYLKEQNMEPQDLLFTLYETAQALFLNSNVIEFFKIEVDMLAMGIYSAATEIYNKKMPKPLSNAWKTLFGPGSSEACRKAILSDLNIECVRLIRKTEASELCDSVKEYLSESSTSSEDSNGSEKGLSTASKRIEPPPATIADLFNGLAALVGYSVLMAETKAQMLTNFETCIKMAHEAMSPPYVNLLVAQAIYAGINTVGVSTLKLEEKIGRKEREYLHEIEKIFNPNGNYRNYRAFCRESKYPVIPYVGLFALELTMACEVKKNVEQVAVLEGLVESFDKSRHLLKVVLPIRHPVTDCFIDLMKAKEELPVPCPPAKIELVEAMPWKEGEWNSLTKDDKLYFYSRWRWHK